MPQDEPMIVRVVRWLVDDEERHLEHRFEVDVSQALRPILERLEILMEASQDLGAVVDSIVQAVRDAEGRVQVRIGELEAEVQSLTATGSPEEAAAMDKLNALKQEVAGIVPAVTDAGGAATQPPADTPPADTPPADTPPADAPPAGGDPAPPSDTPAPPADTPPADTPPADAPPADPGTPPTP